MRGHSDVFFAALHESLPVKGFGCRPLAAVRQTPAAGVRPRFDLARVVALIGSWSPDIMALQEVDSRRKLEDGRNPFTVLQQALGKHGINAQSIVTKDGEYGQMLISCCPLRASAVHDISFPEREPRRAITAEVEAPQGTAHIVATHLGLSIKERRGQARRLLALAGNGTLPTVVLGDFNHWFWPESVRSLLAGELPGRTRYRTFPARAPLLRLDRIYCRPRGALIRSFIDPRARAISDHLPVIADVTVA